MVSSSSNRWSRKPVSVRSGPTARRSTVPPRHQAQASSSWRTSSGRGPSWNRSQITSRPPAASTRLTSRNTGGLLGNKLNTPFISTQWNDPSLNGSASPSPAHQRMRRAGAVWFGGSRAARCRMAATGSRFTIGWVALPSKLRAVASIPAPQPRLRPLPAAAGAASSGRGLPQGTKSSQSWSAIRSVTAAGKPSAAASCRPCKIGTRQRFSPRYSDR